MNGMNMAVSFVMLIIVVGLAAMILGDASQSQCLSRNATTGVCIQQTQAYNTTVKVTGAVSNLSEMLSIGAWVLGGVIILGLVVTLGRKQSW